MRRTVAHTLARIAACGALACAALPASASAAAASTAHGTVTGRITYISPSAITIQTPGRRLGIVNAMTAAANAITARNYPYVWAGGHPQAGVPSVGTKGPGHDGRRKGFDCSGSVAAVLAPAGLWQPGSPVPGDAGVIGQLLQQHLIASGAGTSPTEVTLYDDPGVHIFMNIDGRFFGTSDGGGGNSKGGPTWLNDGAADASNRHYKRYHVLPSVLANRTAYGQAFTFQTVPSLTLAPGTSPGERATITYTAAKTGALILDGLTVLGGAPAS
jgi:hypothetical protein